MRSLFTPALGSVTRVTYDGVKPTTVRFSAAFTHAEYYDLKRAGGIVQVWTDIPAQGREHGEWSAIPFTDSHTPAVEVEATLIGEAPELSLISTEEELNEEERRLSSGKTLSAQAELEGGLGTYSFTYRIVYPSGGIWWLGEYGRNGMFVLETVVGAGCVGGLSLEPGWQAHSSGWTCQINGETAIGRVPEPRKYRIWSIGSNGLAAASLQEAVLLLFLPRPSHDGDVIPLTSTLVLASGESIVSMKQDGSLSAAGKGSVYVQSPADLNIERVLSLHSSLQPQILSSSTDHNRGCAVLFNRNNAYNHPRHGLVFPSSCMHTPTFSVDLSVDNLITPDSNFGLYSPAASQIQLLSSTSPIVTITAAATGGSFVLTPVYSITPDCTFLLTTPHARSSAPVERNLPTPPPSPRVKSRTTSAQEGPSSPIVVETPAPVAPEPALAVPEKVSADDPPLESVGTPHTSSPVQEPAKSQESPLAIAWKERSIRAFLEALTKSIVVLLFVMVLHRRQTKPLQSISQSPLLAKDWDEEETTTPTKQEGEVAPTPQAEEAEHPEPQHDISETSPSQNPDDSETKSDAGSDSTYVESPSVPTVPEHSLPVFVKKGVETASPIYLDVPRGLSHLILLSHSAKGLHIDLNGQNFDANFDNVGDGVHETSIKASATTKLKISLSEGL